MTTYTAIPNADIDPESPITTNLMTLLRDNPVAITEGATGAPSIANGALTDTYYGKLISTVSASTSATVEFITGLDSTFDEYVITISKMRPATDGVQLRIEYYIAGAWITAGYAYTSSTTNTAVTVTQGSAAYIVAINTVASNAGSLLSGLVNLSDPASAVTHQVRGNFSHRLSAAGNIAHTYFAAEQNTLTAMTGIRFKMSSGNITSGTFRLYGLRT